MLAVRIYLHKFAGAKCRLDLLVGHVGRGVDNDVLCNKFADVVDQFRQIGVLLVGVNLAGMATPIRDVIKL
jgi:hypothetical protein